MNNKNVLLTTALSVALIPGVAGMAEAAIVQTIDPLSATQIVTRSTGGTSNSNLAVSGTIFGNNITRRLTLQTTGNGNSALDIPTLNFGSGIDISSPNGVNPKATIQYRGTLPSAKFAPVDLTVGGLADRVSLGVILNDVPLNASTTFSVTLGSGTSAPVTQNISSNLDFFNTKNPLPIDFLFSSFAGINPTAINTFSIMIDPPTNGDVSIKFLAVGNPFIATPEPATILGLLAVAGAAATFRKKNDQAK